MVCRMTPIDPTIVIERMAGRLRAAGAPHPVSGAAAVAARGHARMGQDEFAEQAGLLVSVVERAERGDTPFGELPRRIGSGVAATGADILALADLEQTWRNQSPPFVAVP